MPVEVNDSDFKETVIASKTPVLLEFWSPSCPYCLKMAKVVDLVAEEYAGRLKVVKMNILENAHTPVKYGVNGIPAFFFIRNGEVGGQTVGVMPKGRLKKDLGLDKLD